MPVIHFRNLATAIVVAVTFLFGLAGCHSAPRETSPEQVVFVCEHGSVKSLIAASLFERAAAERRLAVRAVSRGVSPDERVPAKIVAALGDDGFDVANFRPQPLTTSDLADASRIVAVGVDLSKHDGATRVPIQSWNDVPAASVDYGATRTVLARHIEALLDELQAAAHRSTGLKNGPPI